MATLVLGTVGTLVGGPIGGAIGALAGQAVDNALFGPAPREGARLGALAVQVSSYGVAIPKLFGTMRVAGTVIWSTDLIERRTTTGGGKGRAGRTDYSYSASFAVALSGRPVRGVGRIWADGKLLRGAAGDWKTATGFRLYLGHEEQEADPLIAAAEGEEATAFRGIAYAMFEDLALGDFGNRIPSLTFEVEADAGAVSIGAVAAALSEGAIAAGVTPLLSGFAASGESVRAALQDVAELAGLSLNDDGAVLRIEEAGGAAAVLSRELPGREVVRRAAASIPGAVSIAYHDVARDYQTGLQRAASGSGGRNERRGLAAALSAQAAKGLAERRLGALTAGRVEATVTLTWSRGAMLRTGAVVNLAGEAGRFRVAATTIGPGRVTCELVRIGSASAVAVAAQAGRVLREEDRPHGATTLRVHDLPLGEGAAPFVAVLAAGASPGWRRAALLLSVDDGASWSEVGSTAKAAVIGTTASALGPGEAALFDHRSAVEVVLLHDDMTLLSRDDDALAGGANLALIGDELLQFGRAEQVAAARWRLSRLLRGRRGTEWAAAVPHPAGAPFALIEAESMVLPGLPAGMGAGAAVRLMASGVGDVVPAEAELVLSEASLRPPAPVHVRAVAEAGDLRISWVRRSRAGWNWTSGADTPLGEERELYAVTLSGAGFPRTVETGAAAWVYEAAARAADGPGPVQVEVVQVGTHGRSRAAVVMV